MAERACCTSRCDSRGWDVDAALAATADTGNAPAGNAASVPTSVERRRSLRKRAYRRVPIEKRAAHNHARPMGRTRRDATGRKEWSTCWLCVSSDSEMPPMAGRHFDALVIGSRPPASPPPFRGSTGMAATTVEQPGTAATTSSRHHTGIFSTAVGNASTGLRAVFRPVKTLGTHRLARCIPPSAFQSGGSLLLILPPAVPLLILSFKGPIGTFPTVPRRVH